MYKGFTNENSDTPTASIDAEGSEAVFKHGYAFAYIYI